MALVNKSVLIAYSAEQMFDLVADVARYPEFLPWCPKAELHERQTLPDGQTRASATVHIRYRGITQHFTTENLEKRGEYIRMRFKDGPFRALDGEWRFKPLRNDACKVEFELEYEFSSRLLATLVGPVFSHIAATFVESFVGRAEHLYGGAS
ncbi:MAG TPA: type II toxin-antitoxin system RatA family toxin [Burkholderiaceae bacterium]|nr:type II toxin-antitoxin system RatA family toxin [Burkholderiaceae bacterium]